VKGRPKPNAVDADTLRRWKLKGAQSILLDERLKYMEVEGVRRYVAMMVGVPRIFPGMLPTQASGRWSTTNPPLVNFPPDCVNPACPGVGTEHAYRFPECWSSRDLVGPDSGWWFLHYDLDAIEAKIADADAGDEEALQGYRKGWDHHTLRTCKAYKHPLPPLLTKALHTDPSCEAWRQSWTPPWDGSEDRRRHIIKTVGYATQFCISPKGVLDAKDIEKLGLDPDELVKFAKMYLASRPVLVAHKRRVWEDCAKTMRSYSWYGRRRLLYGDWNTRAKEGWSHRVSSTVTDMQNEHIIKLAERFPESYLVLNSHDGLTWAFPDSEAMEVVMEFVKPLVERERTSPLGYSFLSTASWEWVGTDCQHHRL